MPTTTYGILHHFHFLSLLLLAAFAACGDNAEVQAEESPTPAPAATPTPEPAEPPEESDEQEPEEDNADDDLVAEQDVADIKSQIIGEWYLVSTNTPSPSWAWTLENDIRIERHFFPNGYGVEVWCGADFGRHEVFKFAWAIRDLIFDLTLVGFNFELLLDTFGEDAATGMEMSLGERQMFLFSVEDDEFTLRMGGVYFNYRRN